MLQIVLLAGKVLFLVILYLFLYRVIRSTTRELRSAAPGPVRQASPPSPAPAMEVPVPPRADRSAGAIWSLVVEKSPVRRSNSMSIRA
jgi:hypothetical protein